MKKIIILLLLLFGLVTPVFSEDDILHSETGVVTNIQYEDTEETTKQEVTVKVLTGDFKGSERIIDNMLTGNPAYDIHLTKGDKVILHTEANSDTVATANDVDFFIADIKRDNQIWLYTGIFCTLLLLIGRKKGFRSIIAILATLGVIFSILIPMILNGFCPIA